MGNLRLCDTLVVLDSSHIFETISHHAKEKEYADIFANPYRAAERGFIDEVIHPEQTRLKLIKAFAMLENKVDSIPRKKHGNIPL